MSKVENYSDYKDSRIHDSIQLPKHWKIKRFKHIFSFGKGLSITKENLEDDGIECVNYGEIHSKYGFEVNPEIHALKCVNESYLKNGSKSLLNFGDFVFADTSEDIEGSGNFTHLNSSKHIFAGYHTVICRPRKTIHSKYFAYLLDSQSFRSQIQKRVKGVKVYSITQNVLKDTFIWIPDDDEQIKIVNFLDTKTTQIDEVIRQKEELIKLLKERRQVLIHKAVTQGLDSTVKMKDSGVEWIGEIPVHWEVKRAKYLFDEIDERSDNGTEELLSVSHMTGVTPRSEKKISMFMAEDYSGSKVCHKDDLIFNIMWAWMGALGVSDRTGIVSPSYAVYRQQEKGTFNSQYLEYLLGDSKYVAEYNRRSTGLHSSRLRLYSHMFFNMELGVPPKEEQDEIVYVLNIENTKMDNAIKLQENQIEKIKEYKATLIDSCVTGKVKVL